jgi:predicted metal-dependent HD superfamily phosphohydrolase
MSVTEMIRQSNQLDYPAQLQGSWLHILATFGVPEAGALAVFHDLTQQYAGPGRYYHTLPHIGQVLATIESLREDAVDVPTTQLAVWFHDVIYDPRAGDNEEQSAAYAARVLQALAIPAETIHRVCAMILATKSHECAPDDYDTQLLLDADLATLGADGSAYQRYRQAIRQEYAWVPDAEYRRARRQILRRFLDRDRIYHTSALHAALEARARQNIAAEIAALT